MKSREGGSKDKWPGEDTEKLFKQTEIRLGNVKPW